MFIYYLVKWGLTLCGLYKTGVRNAQDVGLVRTPCYFQNLPDDFQGYRILYLSDIHFDMQDGLLKTLCEIFKHTPADLLILGGDYEIKEWKTHREAAVRNLRKLVTSARVTDGILAVNGNHDSPDIMDRLKQTGVTCLLDQSAVISRGVSSITVTGIEYFRGKAQKTLGDNSGEPTKNEFKICLYHSPILSREADISSFSLYLCGHTHAGQIHLPVYGPVITHTGGNRDQIHGRWMENSMLGYTSSGAGTSGAPVRFGCRGEVVLFELNQGSVTSWISQDKSLNNYP